MYVYKPIKPCKISEKFRGARVLECEGCEGDGEGYVAGGVQFVYCVFLLCGCIVVVVVCLRVCMCAYCMLLCPFVFLNVRQERERERYTKLVTHRFSPPATSTQHIHTHNKNTQYTHTHTQILLLLQLLSAFANLCQVCFYF